MKTIAVCIALALTLVSNAHGEIHKSYSDAYHAAKADGKPLVVLISAVDWCPPCKLLKPTVDAMQKDGSFDGVHFYYLDYDKEKKLAIELDAAQQVPVFVKFKKVDEGATFLRGNKSKSQIIRFLGEKKYEFKFKSFNRPSKFKTL